MLTYGNAVKNWLWLGCAVLLVMGCADAVFQKGPQRYSSSIVEYLYPSKKPDSATDSLPKDASETPSIPRLVLPLHVGIAFVPDGGSSLSAYHLTEKNRLDLMERISAEFKSLPSIQDIQLIPSAYLRSGGGFSNIDELGKMYGIDVIVLLAYDQVQHTDEGLLSLSYWTIVGAYTVKGEMNDTSTLMDAAVYDIRSRKMLFRAPGTSHVKGTATLINRPEQMRIDASQGFTLAADELVINLRAALENFHKQVRQSPDNYIIEQKPSR